MNNEHSQGAFIVFKEHLKLRHMSAKERKEYAQTKGVEAKGASMLEELLMLALVEAYDRLYEEFEEYKNSREKQ